MIFLPDNWQIYYNFIRDRSRDLIKEGIWEGIEQNQFDIWLRNFQTDEEKYFSACILDSLIFRSKKQTQSLIFHLLYSILPNRFREDKPIWFNYKNFPDIMQSNAEPNIRFVSCLAPNDPGTKSTNAILRLMRIDFGIRDEWIIDPSQVIFSIKKGINAFIFIDDFLGTGSQFCKMISGHFIRDSIKDTYNVFATLIAHSDGVAYVKDSFPYIKVVQSELIDASYSFFESYFSEDGNSPAKAIEFYQDMLRTRNIILEPDTECGYCNQALTVAFDHGTPDNSLPILFLKPPFSWQYLCNR